MIAIGCNGLSGQSDRTDHVVCQQGMPIENYLSLYSIEGYFSVDDYANIAHTNQ